MLATASRDRARIGREQHVDLVLGDQLLVELDGGLGVRLVVEQHELDLVAEQAAPAVHLVDPHLDRVHLPARRLGEAPGLRDRPADHCLFRLRPDSGRGQHQDNRERG